MSAPPGRPPGSSRGALATLGGGCFWCTEAVFLELRGVIGVVSGYAGGAKPNPTYEQVCSGRTGHAEVVQVEFDPTILSYHDLLTVFLTVHDPTTLNRQGADVGTQYRSVILFHDPAQKATAHAVIAEVQATGIWRGKLVTEVAPLTQFFPAEEYHRDYFRRHPEQAYCRMVIEPKVAKFRAHFVERLRDPPGSGPDRRPG
ncbi:MAG: peptide-methionine (S)-S-oxide reductase MsrA [Thermoplasmata archaeon]|nr:peptide-methionine (S)-S-oxide reductase MsrA [Thermoplasmata archaeon]